ncbi:MAG: prolipoprotein diacylglyceryl transferase [Kiritimatiellae bacterium]|nr:prolipoprotein diacylglyceryl transferase [Kiritimatiellia bacterium]
MYPQLFTICGITIQTYGLLMAIGFSLCYCLATILAKRSGRNPDEVQTIVMLAAFGGVLGARIIYVWQNWTLEFAENPLSMFMIWRGGLVFYGGFILAAALILLYALLKKERILSLADFCAVFVPLGHFFGRIGCFFFGCCYGRIASDSWLGCSFPKGSPPWLHQVGERLISPYSVKSLPVCPTQLIEALGCGILFGCLWWVYRRYRLAYGLCTAIYCAGYAGLRFIIECFRDDPRGETYWGLTFSQLISLELLAVAMVLLITIWRRKDDGTVCS